MTRIVQHVFFWLIFWFWSSAIVDWHSNFSCQDRSFYTNLFYMARRLPIIMASTYTLIYYIVPKFLFEKKAPYLFVLVFSINFLVTNVIDRFYIAFTNKYATGCSSNFWYSVFVYEAAYRNSLILIAVLGLASLIKFFKLHLVQEERNSQLKIENLETKHAFLKAQVNPHFLFNALNNIYSMSVQNNQDKIAANISNLSGIMKYLTYESNNDFVSIEKEIDLIKDYIKIQQLRLDDTDEVTISFNIEGDFSDKFIAPVILLPLVENCFKHGIKLGSKGLIIIRLNLIGQKLYFKTKNYFFSELDSNQLQPKGVGIVNVEKRLEMIYENSYNFKHFIEDQYYILDLNLELKA